LNDRIIAKNRYKKVSQKKIDEKKKKLEQINRESSNLKPVKRKRESFFSLTIVKIIMVIVAILLLSILSKIIITSENIKVISSFFDDGKKYEDGYSLKIGTYSSDESLFKARSLIVNDLYNIATKSLVKIDKNYSVTFELAKKIEKEEFNYHIFLNESYGITADNVKSSIYKILSNTENIYYSKLQIISDVKVIQNNELEIKLKDNNEYFIYYLDFPIYIDEDIEKNIRNIGFSLKTENSVMSFKNLDYSKIKNLSEINLTKYSDYDLMINDFKAENLDITFLSSYNIEKLIGKYDYSMKKFRDGKTLFLLGNINSKIFREKEIRQALLYCINREEIIKRLNNSYIELIDIPYINSKIYYKYDITGANNVLLSNGYSKDGGIYKKDDLSAIFSLLVNKDDKIKVTVAESIKEMAEINGIRIDISYLSLDEIALKMAENSYDLVLADIYLDESPDISYLYNFINVSDDINNQIELIKLSSLDDISKNISELQNLIYRDVACIGLYAYDTAIVYQNYITGFENISYKNVFKNINIVGKIKE